MRVAIVLNTSWNIYNFRMNLVKSLINEGHEVITVAPHDEYTHYLEEVGCVHHDLKMDSRGANPIKDFLLVFELFSVYRKYKPDVVLHFTVKPNVYGTLAAALLNIPSVNNVCGLGTIFLKKGLVSQVAIGLYRLAFLFPKKVFFQNPDDRAIFLEKRLVSRAKCDLLPGSGIDLEKFKKTPLKRNSPFTFLMISRIIKDKGIKEYIEAIRHLKSKGINARFQLLGAKDPAHKRGIAIEEIQEWIDSSVIEYLGKVNDVRPYIESADCIVLPSYREGTPRTLLEAGSMARPIVTTNVPGCNHVVTNGFNGLLCDVRSAADLADKMATIYAYSEIELQAIGENSRKKIEQEFDEQIVINKYLVTIKNVGPATEFADKEITEKMVISRN